MSAPRKYKGLTAEQWTKRCTGKHRWADAAAARAGALTSLQKHGNVSALWVYKCPHCQGWHLTKKAQNEAPAAQANPVADFEVLE